MTVDGQNFAKCSASASANFFSGGVKNEKGALSKTTENDVIKWSFGEKICVCVCVCVSLLATPILTLLRKFHRSGIFLVAYWYIATYLGYGEGGVLTKN